MIKIPFSRLLARPQATHVRILVKLLLRVPRRQQNMHVEHQSWNIRNEGYGTVFYGAFRPPSCATPRLLLQTRNSGAVRISKETVEKIIINISALNSGLLCEMTADVFNSHVAQYRMKAKYWRRCMQWYSTHETRDERTRLILKKLSQMVSESGMSNFDVVKQKCVANMAD